MVLEWIAYIHWRWFDLFIYTDIILYIALFVQMNYSNAIAPWPNTFLYCGSQFRVTTGKVCKPKGTLILIRFLIPHTHIKIRRASRPSDQTIIWRRSDDMCAFSTKICSFRCSICQALESELKLCFWITIYFCRGKAQARLHGQRMYLNGSLTMKKWPELTGEFDIISGYIVIKALLLKRW